MRDDCDPCDSDGLPSILADYLARIDRGEPISRDNFIVVHPDHATALRDYFANADLIERLTHNPTNALAIAQPATPRPFGNYELLAELGRGGMGVVYEARERSTGRTIALKMLLHGLFLSPTEIRRFRNEASLAAGLEHRGIVPIYHVDEHEGHLFYTMPLVQGENLAQRLATGPLDAKAAAKLLFAIAEAVAFAHSKGVVHRDLKPANILLDEDGNPHVADFGLARRSPQATRRGELEGEPLNITATGDMLGTPNYMAPEQVNGNRALIGSATDVYALGAVLYALLVGQPPFHSESVSETLHKIGTTEPTRPRQLNRSVPRDLETICLKCLEKSPQNRYPSGRELAEDLHRFLEGKPLSAQRVSRTERTRRWFARNPVVGSLAVGILLALIAGSGFSTYYALQSRQREREALANLYAADMNLAQQHLRAGAVASAIRLLKKHLPDSSQPSALSSQLRTMPWEWRHLWHQCHGELRRFEGPVGPVYSVSFSPDGRAVAAAGADKTLWLWETATGKVKHKLQAHTATIRDLAFTPDGKRIVTVGDEGVGIIWDATTGEQLATLQGHEHPLTSVAISADGRFIATGGEAEPNVNLWNASTGDLFQSLDIGPAASLEFDATDCRLAIAGRDYLIRVCQQIRGNIWEITSTIRAHTDHVRDVSWSPDSTRLASGGADRVVRIWDTNSWTEREAIKSLNESIYSIDFRPDGQRLAIAGRDAPLLVWDGAEEQLVARLPGHTALVTSIDYCPDGWRLVSASEDGTVRLWDAAHAADHQQFTGHQGPVRSVAFSPDGRVLSSGGYDDCKIILWNRVSDCPIRTMQMPPRGLNDMAFSPTGRFIAAVLGFRDRPGYLCIWDIEANQPTLDIALSANPLLGVAWAPAGNKLVVRAHDGAVRLVDASSGRELACWPSAAGPHGSIAFSGDGELIIGAGGDNSVRVWSTTTHSLVHELQGHTAPVVTAVFNRQGSVIASSSNDHTIRLWDARTGQYLRTLRGHSGTPIGLAFSPDGSRLASGGSDRTIRLWDTETGLELQTITGHTNWARDIAFSRNGEDMASAGYDGFVRVWRAPNKIRSSYPVREAAALVDHLAARFEAREPLLKAISAEQTVSKTTRAAASDLASETLFYWSPMLAGHRAAERGDWPSAVKAFERATSVAPLEAELWYLLASASIAADRQDTYEHACNKLLSLCERDANANTVYQALEAWLVPTSTNRDYTRIEPLMSAFQRHLPDQDQIRWLYVLRTGGTPSEFLNPTHPLLRPGSPATLFVQALAWHKARHTAQAVSAYHAALRLARATAGTGWSGRVYRQSLQREVESLLTTKTTSDKAGSERPSTANTSTPSPRALRREVEKLLGNSVLLRELFLTATTGTSPPSSESVRESRERAPAVDRE